MYGQKPLLLLNPEEPFINEPNRIIDAMRKGQQ